MSRRPLLALLLLAGLLAGCGDQGAEAASSSSSTKHEEDEGEEVGAERSGTPATVDCPADATPVDVPGDLSAPLPQGTVVVAVDQRDDGRTVLTGVVPAAEPDVLADLQQAYAAAGITLTEGETEERDAESNFTGNGLTGRWGIRALEDCTPAATRIDLVVRSS
ncbi:hypothetical protein [Petropleomorpha daqingensis]|uniref:Putative small lipoprotein YifL n=1 Tax=Petropleomorpha daqingensis TaxID=2026353 RepID=A0A853C9H0_9ACTN|nr:hypothetical protein [Petropleomorpha daqingensis]NYJ03811.1 putative small lipoprotein YifL [Petropleomorpha daqingensis]